MNKDQFEYLAREVFMASLEVHKELGPGLLESVYEYALINELSLKNINYQRQVKIPLFYKGVDTGKDFFIDLLLENEIIVELKAIECLMPVHEAQVLSYLKLTKKKMGFLINFNVPLIKNGFKRFVNNY